MRRVNVLPWLLGLSFFLYSILSWVLFFRDERAVGVISSRFYPQLDGFLTSTRTLLLSLRLNTIPTVLFAGLIIFSFIAYFLSLKEKISAKKVILFGILFQVIVFFSYPVLSSDVLSYILSDRVAAVYHQNVWTTRPDRFKSDPFFGLADWTDQTRIYGGVNQAIYTLAAQVSGNDFVDSLASHKLIVFIGVLASMAVSAKILSRYFPENLVSGLALVFWNPLFVIETVGSGHNDILMLFFLLLSYFFFLGNAPILAGLALALSTQVKTTSLLLAIFLAGYLFGKRRFLDLAKFASAYGAVLLVIYRLMGVDLSWVIGRTGSSILVYWQSLPMLVHILVPQINPLLTLLLIIFMLLQLSRTVFLQHNPLTVYAQTLFVYLLFFLNAYWNWYPIWILALLPFLPSGRFRTLVLALTLSSLLAYAAYWTSLRFNYRHPIWPFVIYFALISGPVAVLVHEKFVKKISI